MEAAVVGARADADPATAVLLGEQEDIPETVFVNLEEGDLHLAFGGLGAIDAGEDIPDGLADHDFEGDPRLGTRDLGADEYVD